jgi:type I restriction enzyme, S subunit
MRDGWRRVQLSQVLDVKHGYAFKSKYFSTDLTGRPIVVNIGNFCYGGGFAFDTTLNREYRACFPGDFKLAPNDLLVVMTCQTSGGEILGVPAFVPDDGRTYLHNQRIGKVFVDKNQIDIRFAYYLFKSPETNRQLVATATGTKILHTSPQRIREVTTILPNLSEQCVIAEVLSALDGKIDANKRLMDACAGLGSALFREATTNTASMLSKIATLTMGQSPPGDTYNGAGAGLPFHQGTRDFGFRYPRRRVWCSAPSRVAEPRDVLVSVRAPVGTVNVAIERCAIGRGLSAARSKHASTLYQAITADPTIWSPYESEGTVFGSINKQQLSSLVLPWPSAERLDELENKLAILDHRLLVAETETLVVSEMRDTLLPPLLSGELRVRDVEPLVGEVV